jgi:signal peptidase I
MPSLYRKLLLRLLLAAVGLVAVAVAARIVLYQGLLGPVRVVSGSMAETLAGEHYLVACADCGLEFRCDRDRPPPEMQAVCPNCGYAEIAVDAGRLHAGQRVLIDQLVAATGLARWEMVAFASPDQPDVLAVKRIVGLPGERVEIRGGDVFIDGRIARKDLPLQRELAVLVHDNDHRPGAQTAGLPPRWQPDAADSRWQARGGGFAIVPAAGSPSPTPSSAAPLVDWLTYRHWRCVRNPLPRTEESPIRDSYGYNQGVSRQLHVVTDLMLVCRVNVSGNGRFVVRIADGRDVLDAEIEPAAERLRLLRNDVQLGEVAWPQRLSNGSVELLFSRFDRQAIVAADGQVLIAQPLDQSARPLAPTTRPVAIGASGVSAAVEQIRIFRDLHYLDPQGFGQPWEASRPLSGGEVFVLGDNVPISRDSRVWPEPLKREAVVGGVVSW